jgi:hypothetical protein
MKRITRKLVRINHRFRIADRNWTYPAGEYEITTEEEELGGNAYRRLKTIIYIPKSKGPTGEGSSLRLPPGSLTRLFNISRIGSKVANSDAWVEGGPEIVILGRPLPSSGEWLGSSFLRNRCLSAWRNDHR